MMNALGIGRTQINAGSVRFFPCVAEAMQFNFELGAIIDRLKLTSPDSGNCSLNYSHVVCISVGFELSQLTPAFHSSYIKILAFTIMGPSSPNWSNNLATCDKIEHLLGHLRSLKD